MNAATKTLTISAFVSLLLLVSPAIALGEPNPAPAGDIITVPDAVGPGASGQGDPGGAGYEGDVSPVPDDSGAGNPQGSVDSPAAAGSGLNGSSAGASDGQAVNSLAGGDAVSSGDDAAGLPSSGAETLPKTMVILILAAIILAAVTALVILIRRFRASGMRLS